MVRVMDLNPYAIKAHAPQTCLSADSSTLAYNFIINEKNVYVNSVTINFTFCTYNKKSALYFSVMIFVGEMVSFKKISINSRLNVYK